MTRIWIAVVFSCAAVQLFAGPYYFETASEKNVWVDVDAWVGEGSFETGNKAGHEDIPMMRSTIWFPRSRHRRGFRGGGWFRAQ
mgnify:CR=1 FL=1